jgi:uncharacterized protein (DUF1330 family)
MAITPNKDQFVELAGTPDTGPVVMLNMLKFKARADGPTADAASPDQSADETGAEAYRKYGEAAVQMVEARGGTVLWAGRADQILIGDPAEDWDQIILVQYPSRAAFIDMVSQPEYQEAHTHRESGLERSVLVACTPGLDRLTGSDA